VAAVIISHAENVIIEAYSRVTCCPGWGISSMSMYRLTVTPESGPSLCPVYIKAERRRDAIALARSHGLVIDGERATAVRINGEALYIDFGCSVIAIGEHQKS
jgi:hypothetical protein